MSTLAVQSGRVPLGSLDSNQDLTHRSSTERKLCGTTQTTRSLSPLRPPIQAQQVIANPEEVISDSTTATKQPTTPKIFPIESIVFEVFCEDPDPFIQSRLISHYIHSSIFHNEPTFHGYKRIESIDPTTTERQKYYPIYIDEAYNSCIVFSAHSVQRGRRTERSTGKLQMHYSELNTTMMVSHEVWRTQKKTEGPEIHNTLLMFHFSVTRDDVWLLSYLWTPDLFFKVQEFGPKACKFECDVLSYRRCGVRWMTPYDWAKRCIEIEEELLKQMDLEPAASSASTKGEVESGE